MQAAPTQPLFAPLTLGALELRHRFVLVGAPRGLGVTADGAPDPSLTVYFATRATPGGLLICAAAPTPAALTADSRPIPGIHSASQVNAWRNVTDAIHARGGLAMVQLGDAANDPLTLPDLDGIETALEAYRAAAENAADAGFDGVELLCTQGTLSERFSRRPDGQASVPCGIDTVRDENFVLDALQAIVGSWPTSSVGVCLSLPESAAELPGARALLASAKALGLPYAHLVSLAAGTPATLRALAAPLRAIIPGKLIVSGGWTPAAAAAAIEAREIDAVGVDWAFAVNAGLGSTEPREQR